jgi:hypothetical protein
MLQLAAAGHAHVRLAGQVCRMTAPARRVSAASSGARYALSSCQRAALCDRALEAPRRRLVAHYRGVLAARLLREGQAREARGMLAALRAEAPELYRGRRLALSLAAALPAAGGIALRAVARWRAWWRRAWAPD